MATSNECDAVLAACLGRRANGSGWVRVNCPVCPARKGEQDRRASLGYQPATGGFRCFRCGVAGRATGDGFVQREEPAPEERPAIEIPHEDFFPLWTPEMLGSLALAHAREFLERRGILVEHWYAADIHGAVSGYYAGRVIVPHVDERGEWWGFTARLWGDAPKDGPPKVLYPRNMDRGRMYNEQALRVETSAPVMVVEGCLDAAWYLPDVVAALGKPTAAHVDLLSAARRPVVVCLDGDAWEQGRALAYRLRLRGVEAGFVRLPPQEDPNSVDAAWLRQQIENADRGPPCRPSTHSQSSQQSPDEHAALPSTS